MQAIIKGLIVSVVFSILLPRTIHAQTPYLNSADILQSLNKLNTLGSVLYIAAHPDDENTRLLAYLSKQRNLRTGYLSLTRGDGGQNLIGKEQGELLGVIRTQELLAARRIDGAEQFFTRANDFGYSKGPDETLKFWNRDSILADMVWCIRKFRPDVIICRFPTTGEGGHGHHTASAILSLEAFDAAADPNRFPEQLAYTTVWKVKRIFWNTFNFGTTNTTSEDQLKIDIGVFNPLIGKGYGEVASESRSMHKSQGFGSAKTRGSAIEYFKLLKGDSAKTDLFDGIDQTWKRIGGLSYETQVNNIIKKYNPQQPELIVPNLIVLYNRLMTADRTAPGSDYWCERKLEEIQNLILACSGIWLEATASDYMAIPGNTVDVMVQAIVRNKQTVSLNKISYFGQADSTISLTMKYNELYSFKHRETLSANIPFSNPYWLNEQHTYGMFIVKNQQLIGKPQNDAAVMVTFNITVAGLQLTIQRPLVYKYTDPVRGEVYRNFEVLPPATVNISDKVLMFPDSKAKNVHFTVKANKANVSGTLDVKLPAGWKIDIKDNSFKIANKGDETVIEGLLTPGTSNGTLSASVTIDSKTYSKSITRIEYDHIPYQFILSEAEAKLVNVNLQKTGLNIGYIPGAGDDVAACLKQVGYNVTILTDELLENEDLSKYNAIVTGVRAYNTNERLQAYYNKLMAYVNNGGNLIVQYNTNSRVGPMEGKIGPYPFKISRDRVTDETAEVRMLNPADSVLNYPNKITVTDFEGWKQERGIYFVDTKELDKNYRTVFSMTDPGATEKPSEGSLIIAHYGKGNFIYTGIVFFRELPAGVPGAYRLFANLLSLPAKK